MKIGDKVIATFPDKSESDVGTIVAGPEFRNNIAAFKIRYTAFDNWVPVDWLKPALKTVDKTHT